uniref:Uncharacterized protein n=1 Tax=Peronospora matthiolae TaxID=2874970 RepID=A0AAV1TFC9_9STRA
MDPPTTNHQNGHSEPPTSPGFMNTTIEEEVPVEDASREETVPVPPGRNSAKAEKAAKARALQLAQKLEKVQRVHTTSLLIEETFITHGLSKSEVKEVLKQLASRYHLLAIHTYQTPVVFGATRNQSSKKRPRNQQPVSKKKWRR